MWFFFPSSFPHFMHLKIKKRTTALLSVQLGQNCCITEFFPSICKFHYSELCMFFLRRYRLPYLSSPSSALADRSPFSESHPSPRRKRALSVRVNLCDLLILVMSFVWIRCCCELYLSSFSGYTVKIKAGLISWTWLLFWADSGQSDPRFLHVWLARPQTQ